jgi:hypothetical protein
MPRLSIVNFFIGFLCLCLGASAGVFIATSKSAIYLVDGKFPVAWADLLKESAHGHFNLFALIHIALGLTLPYSKLQAKWKMLQTIGLGLGTLAMGPGLWLRAVAGPENSLMEYGLGACLSLALLALVAHTFALAQKLASRF